MFNSLSDRLRSSFKNLTGRGRLSEDNIADAMREVRRALLEADVALPVTRTFIDKVQQRAVGKEVLESLTPSQAVIKVVHEELVTLMGEENAELNLASRPPAVVFVAGLQGAGKTTSVGKLAKLLKERHQKKVMVVSTDIRRPAAIEQLALIANQVDVQCAPSSSDQDPVDIVNDALQAARKSAMDVLIVDTAGRLHVDEELMQEVQRIHQAINPVETLFVVDSMTGQDAVISAQAFDAALPLTGVILTKTDGDARGGAALSIREVTGKPIKFIGSGEAMDALEPFHPDRIASRILGMGDVLTLVEEVERKVDRKKADALAKKITKGKGFDLEDFRDQMEEMQRMGGMMGMMDKLPGLDRVPDHAKDQFSDKQTRRTIAIINSMTPQERRFPATIKGSRKKRIALGSGTDVPEINRLLKQFMQMQKMMKKMKGGKMKRMMSQFKGQMPGMPF